MDAEPDLTPEAVGPTSLAEHVRTEAIELGFDAVGIAPLRASDHAAFYEEWLRLGRHGGMAYLARPDAVVKRSDPRSAWPGLRSAVVVAHNYRPSQDERHAADPSRAIIARYARGRDYHRVIRPRLLRLLRLIEQHAGRALPLARAYVDTGPVFERELARRAGLGWFGRNTMLIDPRRGSYFFLGCLLLEIELDADDPFDADHCGTCNACVEACPTGALLGRDANGAPVIDARTCISYLTIENRGPIPREMRPLMGNRVFGCDICQEVCPWNEGRGVRARARAGVSVGPTTVPAGGQAHGRGHGRGRADGDGDGDGGDAYTLVGLMGMGEAEWEEFSRGSAVRRARRAGFLRNVAVALGNWGSAEAVPALVRALSDPEPLVRGHAAWALGRIGSAEARSALAHRRSGEADEAVRAEIVAALAAAGGDTVAS